MITHPGAQLLSVEDAADMGLQTDGPVWLVPVESAGAVPSLGYELPASALPSEKDPGLAIIIGILLPGGAQIYAGDNPKGLMILGVAYGSLIGGWFLSHALDVPLLAVLGSAGYIAATVYGVLQATDDVEAANRRNGFALAPSVTRTDGGYAGGLSLRASF
jgi:TM2 domain-containing membrane protein YozV